MLNSYSLIPINKKGDDAHVRLNKLFRIGFRILLLGVSPETFMGRFGLAHVFVYFSITVFTFMYGWYELIGSFVFESTLLERWPHWYAVYYSTLTSHQWIYMVANVKKIYSINFEHESYNSTKAVPEVAMQLAGKHLHAFMRILIPLVIICVVVCAFYILAPIVEKIAEYYTYGYVENVSILPTFPIPFWAQFIVSFVNMIALILVSVYVSAMYILTNVLVLKIRIQCEIINEALAQDIDLQKSFRGYIMDHINVIRKAKSLIAVLEEINSSMFMIAYLSFAMILFSLTLIEATTTYYISIASDFIGLFLIVFAQGWISTTITSSLESISNAAYNTAWYKKNRSQALETMMMIQMSQRPYVQKIWLGTLNIERMTALQVLQWSYSFYTILMIFQQEK